MANNTAFAQFIQEQADIYRGTGIPVKASVPERLLIRKANLKDLHPNREDEFCDPDIGPNYEIISHYERDIREARKHHLEFRFSEPLMVQKMHPNGYMLLNGHHRWAAAIRMGLKNARIKIVNVTQESDIVSALEHARHDRRVTLDLDEVVFVHDPKEPAEKALRFPFRKLYKERLRAGIPSLFYALRSHGYDIWVYSAQYYSIDYIGRLFHLHHAELDGIITGGARKRLNEAGRKKIEEMIAGQYAQTIHIDNIGMLRVDGRTRSFEEFSLSGDPGTWSREIINVIENLDHEKK